MVDLGGLADKAKELISEHGDQVDEAVEKAGEFVKGKFGHDEQVDSVVDKIREATPDKE